MKDWGVLKDGSAGRIFAFLRSVDGAFTPSLSSRVDLNIYSEKLANDAENIFLTSNGMRIAHAAFYCNDRNTKVAFVSSINVRAEFRGKGAGEFLIDTVIQNCVATGMEFLQLEVHDENPGAISFYRKLGFEINSSGLMEKRIT